MAKPSEKKLIHFDSQVVNGVRIHYGIAGTGRPLLLWHGFLGTSHSWHKLVPRLSERFTVIVPDMRGYGDSEKPEHGYDAMTLCEDFRQLMHKLGFKKTLIAAHDMGAPPALRYAGQYPDEVEALAYLEAPVLTTRNLEQILNFSESGWAAKGGLWWWQFAFAADMPERLIVGNERKFLTWFYETYLVDQNSIDDATIDEYLRSFSGVEGVRGAFGVYRELFQTIKQTEELEASNNMVRVPILGLGGTHSMGDMTRQMLQTVGKDVSGGTIENCGHFIPEETPDLLCDKPISFFEDH